MDQPGPGRTLRPSGSHRTTRLPREPFIYPPADSLTNLSHGLHLKVGSIKVFAARSKTYIIL
jgi:hypothetical protein